MSSLARTVAQDVEAKLLDDILRGQYRPGERLPSERDLAARFNASRGVVREALKKLEQLGLADIRPGGVRVVPIEEATLEVLGHLLIRGDTPDPRLVSEVLDVYGALMSMSARTAIQQADDAQIEHMREIVRNLLDHPDGPQHDWRTLGVYFTKVNQNLVLRLVSNGLKTQFLAHLEALGPSLRPDPARATEAARGQLETLDVAIAARDAAATAHCITEHFAFIESVLLKALATRTPTQAQVRREVSS